MKYLQARMSQLVKSDRKLQQKLKHLMKEHDLGKAHALKALYHAEVADSGKYMNAYKELDGIHSK